MRKKVSCFVFIIFIALQISGCGSKPDVPIGTSFVYQTEMVMKGNILESEDYIGYIKPSKETVVSSEVGGKVKSVFFEVGDDMKMRETLATIDTNETDAQYNSSLNSVKSLNDLYKNTSDLFDSQIKSAKSKIKQAEIAMKISEVGNGNGTMDKELKQLELQIETVNIELEKTTKVLKTQEQQLYKNAINSILNAKIGLDNIGNFIDELFGISRGKINYNDNYEIYLGAKKTSLKNGVKSKWFKLNKKYKELSNEILKYKEKDLTEFSEQDKEKLYQLLLSSESFIGDVRNLLEDIYKTVDSSVSSVKFPQSKINSLKSNITSMKENIEKMLLFSEGNFLFGVQGIRQSIDSLKNKDSMTKTLLQKKLEILKQQYETSKDKSGKSYDIAKQKYQEALSSIEILESQKKTQLSKIKTQITQANGQKNTSLVYIENATIKAPFDGIILERNIEVGQFVGPGTPIAVIGSQNLYEVSFSVPVKNLDKYKNGKKVFLNIVDFGKTYTGTIKIISPSTDILTKKIQVKASFATKEDEKIPFGAYTKITVPSKNHIGFVIPIEFIQYNFGKSFVYTLKKIDTKKNKLENELNSKKDGDMHFIKKEIDIDYCNDTKCILKSGLNNNDILIKKSK